MRTLPTATEEELIEYARGIITGTYLVADLSETAWQTSLALMYDDLRKFSNLSLILVPKGPHLSMPWVNGIAPGVTTTCQLVPTENLDRLCELADAMWLGLHPEAQE